jgi:hypothetical protein
MKGSKEFFYSILYSFRYYLDLYSFHRDEECARQTYDQVCDAYERIFQKLELKCFKGLYIVLLVVNQNFILCCFI